MVADGKAWVMVREARNGSTTMKYRVGRHGRGEHYCRNMGFLQLRRTLDSELIRQPPPQHRLGRSPRGAFLRAPRSIAPAGSEPHLDNYSGGYTSVGAPR